MYLERSHKSKDYHSYIRALTTELYKS